MRTFDLFPTYLHDKINKQQVSLDELAINLNHATTSIIQSWISGWSIPSATDLADLAKALRLDLVEVAVGWMIEMSPNLESSLQEHVLGPGGLRFPRSSDLDLRAPKPRETTIDLSFGADDPRA